MMLNKTFYLLLLSLIPLLGFSQANSQYPDSGNKIRLGFQTTGDGLIWRDTQPKVGGYQPINNKAAWIILDTINNKFYHYKNSTWTLAGGQDIDTANLIATKYDLGFKLTTTDTGNMLTPYLRKADTTSIAYVNTYGTQTIGGAKTFTSAVTGARFNPTSSSAAGTGMFLPSANTLGFSTDGVERLNISSTGQFILKGGTNAILRGGRFINDSLEFRMLSSESASVSKFLSFYTSNSSVNTEKLRITSDGNIGIGTTSPFAQLSINGDYTSIGLQPFEMTRTAVLRDSARFSIRNSTNNTGEFLPTFEGISNFLSSSLAVGMIFIGRPQEDNSSDDVAIRFDGRRKISGSLITGAISEFANLGTIVMRIMGSGNVGIGQTTPTARLHVKGSTNAAEFALRVEDSGNNNLLSVQNNGDVTLKNPLSVANGGTNTSTLNLNKLMVGNGTSGVLTPTELHWNNTSKRLGIGTSSPTWQLDIVGLNQQILNLESYSNTYSDYQGEPGIFLTKSASNTVGTKSTTRDGENLGSIFFNGVRIDGSVRTAAYMRVVQAGSAGTVNIPAQYSFYTSDGISSATERLTISPTGNIGIGITSPSQKLHVAGNGLFTGSITANSLSLTTPLSVANGGTNVSSLTSSGVLYASSSSQVATSSNLTFTTSGLQIGNDNEDYNSIQILNKNTTPNTNRRGGIAVRTFENDSLVGIVSTFSASSARVLTFGGGVSNFKNPTGIRFMTSLNTVDPATRGSLTRMQIDSIGNIGINTTSPSEKLHVVGNGLFTGSVTANSLSLTTPLSVANGGTNTSTLTANKVMVGNGTSGVLTPTDLHWDNSNGYLGIGISNPSSKLMVQNTATIPSSNIIATLLNAGAQFQINVVSAAPGGTAFVDLMARSGGSGNTSNAGFKFSTRQTSGDPIERMRILSIGEVNIGYGDTDNGAYPLQVNGQIFATNATIATSDEKFKENITPLTKGLEIVNKLKPVTFNFISDTENNFSEYEEVGFIAQDVDRALSTETFAKSIVKAADDSEPTSTMGLATQNLIPILVKAIQEQQALIKALEQRILILENK